MKIKKENDLKTNCEAESSKKMMRKRVKGKKRVKKKKKKKQGSFYVKASDVKNAFYTN